MSAIAQPPDTDLLTVSKSPNDPNILEIPGHPAANAFPLLRDNERDRLKQSIKEEGCREPLYWWRDPDGVAWLLDGRNRQSICKELGIEPEACEFTGALEEIAPFIISRNIARRHQSKRSQIIAVAQMVLFSPELAAGQRDKRRIVADLGRFAPSTVRYYIEKDLAPTKAATLEERAERRRAEIEAAGGKSSQRERAEAGREFGFDDDRDPNQWADEQAERDTESAKPSGDIYRDLANASENLARVRGSLSRVSHLDEAKHAHIEAGQSHAKDAHRAIKLALLSLHKAGVLDGVPHA